MLKLSFNSSDNVLIKNSLLPFREMAAYEALWALRDTSFKRLSELFASHPNSLPSAFVDEEQILKYSNLLKERIFSSRSKIRTSILINSTMDYPLKLRDAKEPIEVLYFSGNLDFLDSPSVAVVGSRKPSQDGLIRAHKIVKLLVEDGFTIVSGLAEGIDTEAHKTAIMSGGRTISVIGTPLNEYYPKQNKELQEFIAKEHLLISQVPFIRYSEQTYIGNKLFFPERNKTMSAITEATIIVEASDTSGTLIQARAALHQKRKLFILQSCFENAKITWPKKFEDLGAIRVRTYEDIKQHLGRNEISKN